jgi:hypothetical protein
MSFPFDLAVVESKEICSINEFTEKVKKKRGS